MKAKGRVLGRMEGGFDIWGVWVLDALALGSFKLFFVKIAAVLIGVCGRFKYLLFLYGLDYEYT